MEAVLSTSCMRREFCRAGRRAGPAAFRDFAATLLDIVNGVLSAPQAPVPVSDDFWRQYRLTEELEAVRDSGRRRFTPFRPERTRTADVGSRA